MNKPDSADTAARPSQSEHRDGASFAPFVPPSESPAEFTLKAAIPGIIFGILFGAANAYLGLQAGLTISTSIPVAVMTVAAFSAMRRFGPRGTILEANTAQTIGSASSSVASGVIFTLPALFMWRLSPSLMQMTLLALCGGMLGVLFMIPLRRFLIEKEHGNLPYPEGTACAEVLIASQVGGAKARNVFVGLGVGAAFKFIFEWLKIAPGTVKAALPILPKAEVGMKLSAALLGVGYILGPRIATIMVSGGLLSSLVLIPAIAWWGANRTEPLFPETERTISAMTAGDIWENYIRYIGAGAVAAAGIITLIRSIPTMIESFRLAVAQMRQRVGAGGQEVERTSRDLSLKVVGIGALAVVAVLTLVPHAFGQLDTAPIRAVAAVCVAIFAFFFVTVSSRIVGMVGVTSNPTSGMTIASLLGTAGVFLLLGWTDASGMAAALTVGCVVAIAASIAGDTSQDLKTGFLLGATPMRQQIGELLGVLTSATCVCLVLILLDEAYKGDGVTAFGTRELPAPQANLMKIVIEGVLTQRLPWTLVGIGAALAVVAELLRLPSLPFAVGVYLPMSTMAPVFLGGLLRMVMNRTSRSDEQKAARRESGVLLGSGLVGGEGLMGVAVAGAVFAQVAMYGKAAKERGLPFETGQQWARDFAPQLGWTAPLLAGVMGVLLFAMLIGWLAQRIRRDSARAGERG